MILDMSPIIRGETNRLKFEYELEPIPMNGIDFCTGAHVKGEIINEAGYMRLCAHVHLAYVSQCDRCLEPVNDDFDFDFERTVALEGVLTDEQIEDNIDEFVIIQKGKLDIDEQLTEALLLEFPKKILCSESCPGMCQRCGKLLKYGECSCLKKELDPRLACLASLLVKDDENN